MNDRFVTAFPFCMISKNQLIIRVCGIFMTGMTEMTGFSESYTCVRAYI